VIVDNDATSSHRYSLDGVTEVMERRASSPVLWPARCRRYSCPHEQKKVAPPSRRLSGGRGRPPLHMRPKKRKHGLRIHPGSGSNPGRCDVRVRLLQLVD